MNAVRTGLAGLALLLTTATAIAGTSRATVFESVSGADVARILTQAALKPKLSIDSYGDPLISVTSGGLLYELQFYGCETPEPRECESLMFSAGLESNGTMTADGMNHWNRDRRFTRAYLNAEGEY
ncbi:MAG: hypothetical protein HKM95_11565, partial [Inquilinus sp.]|nr:hypothetical protein [Inquilinus sp.]